MTSLLPYLLVAAVVILIIANVIEFKAKRRKDSVWLEELESGAAQQKLQVAQYRQTQNIEQLLHIVVSLLFATLIAALWL